MNRVKKRVLIVDDEEDLTWSISKGLAKDRDSLEVMCVNSGSVALELLSKNSVDLIVTDLRMPGINGLKLLGEIRKRYPQTRVIIMTAYGSLEVREELQKSEGAGYIEKPFEINELRKLIYSYLDENEEELESHLVTLT